MNDLTECIQTTKDARELKRALAVKMMTLAGATWADVMDDLHVSHAFISKWRSQYKKRGIASLRMGYQGAAGYLTAEQKAEIRTCLRRVATASGPWTFSRRCGGGFQGRPMLIPMGWGVVSSFGTCQSLSPADQR